LRLYTVKNLTAGDLIYQTFKTVSGKTSVAELEKGNVWYVVLDKGVAVGIIKDVGCHDLMSGETAANIMSDNFIPVQHTAPLPDLMEIMKSEEALEAFLVQNNGEIIGIIDVKRLLDEIWNWLLESEAKLSAVLNLVNEAITIINDNNEVVGWNHKAAELYGIAVEDISGKKIDMFFQNLVVTQAKGENKEVKKSYHQPRENTHVLISAEPIRVNGNIIGGVSAERDITEVFYLHKELSETGLQLRKLEKKFDEIKGDKDPFYKIVGRSRKLNQVRVMAQKVAKTSASVLIRGESGTGKELFAEAIHNAGYRRDKPFIAVNCAAIPQTLFESELFGYHSGSFTGADRSGRAGKFELANNGTIFLDEIGELHLNMQVKLLRVLQSKV